MALTVTITNASGGRYRGKAAMVASAEKALRGQRVRTATVDVILLDDADIHSMNKQYLRHDYATDVITFPLGEGTLEGEIYISLDTAKRQAEEYGVTLENELCRLTVHGVLHLCGYDDADDASRTVMRQLEDRYITRGL